MQSSLKGRQAIVLHPDDNVATALVDLAPGAVVTVSVGGTPATLQLDQPVPFGHKFALRPIRRGEQVLKYGTSIGVATQAIGPGVHVHVHNLETGYREDH